MSKKIFFPLANEISAEFKTSIASRFLTTTAVIGAAFLPSSANAAEEKVKQLPTVTVIDSRTGGTYQATESSNGKITSPLRDTPRTITTVTRQLMDDQGVTKVSDALRNVPGISLAAGEGGNQGDNLMIRGFSARNDFFVDGMRDFGNYFRDSFNLESVEVVQGPSSVLFGRGSTGGVIQQNSKQAFLGSKKEGTLMLGTNETARATIDVNRKIDALEGAAIRLNAMANSNKVAERDAAQYRRAAFSPNLSFGLGTDTRLNINYLHQDEDNTPDYGVPFYAGKPADVERNNFYGFQSNDHLKTNVDIATVKFEHDFSADLALQNQTRYARYYRDVQVTEPQITTDPSSVTRSMKIRKSLETYLGNQTNLTGKFSTFGAAHTMVTGLALESETSAPTVFAYGNTTTNAQTPAQVGFNDASVTTTSHTKTKIDTVGVYALDTVKLGKAWEISLGARFDNMQSNYESSQVTTAGTPSIAAGTRTILSHTDNLLSYSAGVVYKPAKNGSIYFNHGTSFNPSAESLSLTAPTANLSPEKNTIYEIGTKWDLLKKRLSTSFALFRMDKDNARETLNNTTSVLSGSQQVNGILAQVSGKITDRWNIMAGYSYMEGKLTKSLVNPAYKNRPLANTPEHTFSLFTTYKFESELEIGGGANFVSERFVTPTSAADPVNGTVRNVPSYLTFNLMGRYPLSKNVSLQANINNLTNAYYYDQIRGTQAVVPGEGRVFLLSTNIKF